MEVHSSGQTIFTYTGLYYRIGQLDGVWELRYRVGRLDTNNSTLINWPDGTTIGYIDNMGGVGTNGTYLVSTAQCGINLFYSWAIAP